jgi:hypothetical protein
MLEPSTATCRECGLELTADSPELRVELTDEDKLFRLLRAVLAARVRRRQLTVRSRSSG